MAETASVAGTPNPAEDSTTQSVQSDGESQFKLRLKKQVEKHKPVWIEEGKKAFAAELGLELDELDVSSLKELLAKGKAAPTSEQKWQAEHKKLSSQLAESQRMLSEMQKSQIDRHVADAIVGSLESSKIVPGTGPEIVELTRKHFGFEDGRVVVLDEGGEPSKKKPAEFLSAWLEKHPHYLLATTQGGAGSKPNQRPSISAGKEKPSLDYDSRRAAWLADPRIQQLGQR